MPLRRLLVGVADAQDALFAEGRAEQLQADREAVGIGATGH